MKSEKAKPNKNAQAKKPNIVYYHIDNLGFGELGCYGGGILRGAETNVWISSRAKASRCSTSHRRRSAHLHAPR